MLKLDNSRLDNECVELKTKTNKLELAIIQMEELVNEKYQELELFKKDTEKVT